MKQREKEEQGQGSGMTEILAANVRKVTRFREGGEEQLEREVRRLEGRGRKWGREQKNEEDGEGEEGEGEVVERTQQGYDLIRRR